MTSTTHTGILHQRFDLNEFAFKRNKSRSFLTWNLRWTCNIYENTKEKRYTEIPKQRNYHRYCINIMWNTHVERTRIMPSKNNTKFLSKILNLSFVSQNWIYRPFRQSKVVSEIFLSSFSSSWKNISKLQHVKMHNCA